jgi:transcriptional pleiotropic regulator of transition state genes
MYKYYFNFSIFRALTQDGLFGKISAESLIKRHASTHVGEMEVRGNMKYTGVVRRIDDLGRIVLPVELRRTMELDNGDSLEIFVEDNKIILKKYQPACIFCGDAREIGVFKGRNVCTSCAKEISRKI